MLLYTRDQDRPGYTAYLRSGDASLINCGKSWLDDFGILSVEFWISASCLAIASVVMKTQLVELSGTQCSADRKTTNSGSTRDYCISTSASV